MSERIRDLHPGHDRMTVDISVRLCRRNTSGIQDIPYPEVYDKPWIINSNSTSNAARIAFDSEFSGGLRHLKPSNLTLYVTRPQLCCQIFAVVLHSYGSLLGGFCPEPTHLSGPDLRLYDDFNSTPLLMFSDAECKTSENRCLFTSNPHLLEELSRFLVNRTSFFL